MSDQFHQQLHNHFLATMTEKSKRLKYGEKGGNDCLHYHSSISGANFFPKWQTMATIGFFIVTQHKLPPSDSATYQDNNPLLQETLQCHR